MEEFLIKHPDMINLPKDVLKVRYNNVDQYRKKLIEKVKERRKKIIANNKNSKAESPKKETKFNFELEKDYLDMASKEKDTIDKLKQRQKNQIEAEIEVKIKTEMLKYKSDLKDSLIK